MSVGEVLHSSSKLESFPFSLNIQSFQIVSQELQLYLVSRAPKFVVPFCCPTKDSHLEHITPNMPELMIHITCMS